MIDHDDTVDIAGVIANSPHLEHLDLSGCDLPKLAVLKITAGNAGKDFNFKIPGLKWS